MEHGALVLFVAIQELSGCQSDLLENGNQRHVRLGDVLNHFQVLLHRAYQILTVAILEKMGEKINYS